jgi:hypothetical protein
VSFAFSAVYRCASDIDSHPAANHRYGLLLDNDYHTAGHFRYFPHLQAFALGVQMALQFGNILNNHPAERNKVGV